MGDSPRPLTATEFAAALRKGQGRTVAHLRRYGDAGVEPELLAAFRTNLIHDEQSEGARAVWCFGLLNSVADRGPYRDAVLEALQSDDYWDLRNGAELAVCFAREGDEQMRRRLYARFDHWEGNSDPLFETLVELDVDAFMHVARGLAQRLVRQPDFSFDRPRFVKWAQRSLGKAPVEAALAAAAGDPDVAAFLAYRHTYESREPGLFDEPGRVDRTLAKLSTSRSTGRGLAYGLGRHATPADIDRLIALVEGRPERRQLLFCLWALGSARSERVTATLLALGRDRDADLRGAAIRALWGATGEAVRGLAIESLTSGDLAAIPLFERNFAAGDFTRVRAAIGDVADEDAVHGIGHDLLPVVERNRDSEAVDCLNWLYETTPCSICRHRAVVVLVDLGTLPQPVAEECRDDCDERTRALVAAAPSAATDAVISG